MPLVKLLLYVIVDLRILDQYLNWHVIQQIQQILLLLFLLNLIASSNI
jgi:hypothetical protein